ncbi:unnamed protein product, partial [Prorocentrum cordatum]
AKGKVNLEFPTRWAGQVAATASEIKDLDCQAKADAAEAACNKHFTALLTNGTENGIWHDGVAVDASLQEYLKAAEPVFVKKRNGTLDNIQKQLDRGITTQSEIMPLITCKDNSEAPLKLKRRLRLHLGQVGELRKALIPTALLGIFTGLAEVKQSSSQ